MKGFYYYCEYRLKNCFQLRENFKRIVELNIYKFLLSHGPFRRCLQFFFNGKMSITAGVCRFQVSQYILREFPARITVIRFHECMSAHSLMYLRTTI